jgi:hypothetical protein
MSLTSVHFGSTISTIHLLFQTFPMTYFDFYPIISFHHLVISLARLTELDTCMCLRAGRPDSLVFRVTLPQILSAAPCAVHAIAAEQQLVHSDAKYCAGLPGSLAYGARNTKRGKTNLSHHLELKFHTELQRHSKQTHAYVAWDISRFRFVRPWDELSLTSQVHKSLISRTPSLRAQVSPEIGRGSTNAALTFKLLQIPARPEPEVLFIPIYSGSIHRNARVGQWPS